MAEDVGWGDKQKALPKSYDAYDGEKAAPKVDSAEEKRKAVLRYLGRPREIEKQIRGKKERIRDLRSSLESISVNYSDMPRNPSGPASRMEETLVKVVDLEGEIKELELEKRGFIREMSRIINQIEDADQKTALMLLFAMEKSWESVVRRLGKSRRIISELRNKGVDSLGCILSDEDLFLYV